MTKKTKKKIIILGGGLAGLSAADELLKNKKVDVTILELADHLGGLAASFKQEGEWIPKFYHHIIKSNTHTIAMLKRFGAMKKPRWQRIKIALGVQKKLYTLSKPWEFLRVPGASHYAKLRFALFGLYTILRKKVPPIPHDMNLEDWLHKQCGKEATNYFWWNLYGRNKFNIPLNQISAAQFAERLWEKEGYDQFTFPVEGLEPMIEGLAQSIQAQGGKLFLQEKTSTLDLANKSITHNGRTEHYDIILNTIPVPEFIKFTTGLPVDYLEKLKKVRYCPAVGLCFATKKFLKPGTYWINLFGERVHIIMQHSVLVDKYRGKINWCIRYGGSAEDFPLDEEKIKKEYLASIKQYFSGMEVQWVKVFKEKYAEPIYNKDYASYAPQYETPVEGLYHAGIQVTFPKIRNQNVALLSGEKAAQLILEHITKTQEEDTK